MRPAIGSSMRSPVFHPCKSRAASEIQIGGSAPRAGTPRGSDWNPSRMRGVIGRAMSETGGPEASTARRS